MTTSALRLNKKCIEAFTTPSVMHACNNGGPDDVLEASCVSQTLGLDDPGQWSPDQDCLSRAKVNQFSSSQGLRRV